MGAMNNPIYIYLIYGVVFFLKISLWLLYEHPSIRHVLQLFKSPLSCTVLGKNNALCIKAKCYKIRANCKASHVSRYKKNLG
jgi:hypothetical protein